MALATITSKGQVTIPKKVRQLLKLHAGDKIEIIVTEKNEAIIRPISKKVDDVFGKLHSSDRALVSIKTMDESIKKRMLSKFN